MRRHRQGGRRGAEKAPARASVSLRTETAAFARLVCFVEEFARRHTLPGAERSRLMIVLDELFANVVNHGHVAGTAASIEVALTLKAGELTIDFSDDGPPFDPLIAPVPDLDRPSADRPIGGLGLHILRSLVDHAQYSRVGERNHLVLVRSFPAPDAPERV
jgi:serine/threonine-protein kinase RsbW